MTKDYFIPVMGDDPKIPALDETEDCPDYFFDESRIEDPEPMHYTLGSFSSKEPVPGDFMFTPNLIISSRIHDVLTRFRDTTFQLIPAFLDFNGEEVSGFWGLHIYQMIKCLDRKNSICEYDGITINLLEKMVLNEEVLGKIPLEDRLLFRLKEDDSFMLFHETVVSKIMEINPTGIRFVNVAESNSKNLF